MTLATPLFLIAALAGLIPVLLRFMHRQRVQRLPFSTLRFLRLSSQRTQRRKRLDDFLLLSLQIALLVLISVGLAQPTINRFGQLLGRRAASTDVVLILDNSASMSMVDAEGSRWEAASRVAEQLVDRLGAADTLALLLTCGPSRPALLRLQRDHAAIRQALDECRPRHEGADLALQIRTAEKILRTQSKATHREIYVLTDMQEVSWKSLQREASQRAPDRPPIVLVDLHRAAVPNVAVQQLRLKSTGPVAGMPIQATVELLGDASIQQQRYLELVIDGDVLETSPAILLEPGATAKHTFQFEIDRHGVHHGEVRLVGADACSFDDSRVFAVRLTANIPVAVIKPRSHAIPYLEESFYLDRALRPMTGGDWAIQTTSLNADALAGVTWEDYAVVFCVNLPACDARQAVRLRDYVRQGGHLVWICGDQVSPAFYNAMDRSAQGELLPNQLVGVRGPAADQPDGWHVGDFDRTHPALAPLAEPASMYQNVQVYHYLETATVEEDSVQVLLRLDNGDPLLLARNVGAGSVSLLTTSVHGEWSNLPLSPLFLPLMAGLTFELAEATVLQPLVNCGTPLETPLLLGATGAELIRPDGATIRIDASGDSAPVVRYADTHDVGIYEIHSLEKRRPPMAFAVNLDPSETAPAYLPAESVQARFRERAVVACTPGELDATIRQLREGDSLLEFFLLAVLFALIAEAFVATRRVYVEAVTVAAPSRTGIARQSRSI